jgi:hypothetical protein
MSKPEKNVEAAAAAALCVAIDDLSTKQLLLLAVVPDNNGFGFGFCSTSALLLAYIDTISLQLGPSNQYMAVSECAGQRSANFTLINN